MNFINYIYQLSVGFKKSVQVADKKIQTDTKSDLRGEGRGGRQVQIGTFFASLI